MSPDTSSDYFIIGWAVSISLRNVFWTIYLEYKKVRFHEILWKHIIFIRQKFSNNKNIGFSDLAIKSYVISKMFIRKL